MATERCLYCGHVQDWHRTGDLTCTYEVRDDEDSFIRCYCRGYRT